jgi:hypothetical protein
MPAHRRRAVVAAPALAGSGTTGHGGDRPNASSGPEASNRTSCMQTSRVAKRLAQLYRRGEFGAARAELFAQDAVSVARAVPRLRPDDSGAAPGCTGVPLTSAIETLHGIDVDEPLVAGNRFSVSMALDSTLIGLGRLTLDEICVYYLVAGDKIVSEQFFYTIEG